MASKTDRERCQPCEDGRWLLLAAFILRLAWAASSGHLWGYVDDGLYDDGVFLKMARSLGPLGPAAHFAAHPPGYAYFLALFLKLGGDRGIGLARLAQMALSSAAAPLTYRLALTLRQSRASALIAGAFIATSPMSIYFSSRLMSEAPFVFLTAAFLLAWATAWASGRSRDAAAAGVLGGLATLTRGVILPFGGVLAAAAFLRRRERRGWIRLIAVCGVVWAGAIIPWTARNWIVYRAFAPVSMQGGWNLYEGLTVDPDEILHRRAEAMGDEARHLNLLGDPAALDAHFAVKAKEWIRNNPTEFVHLCAIKALRFWRLTPEGPHGGVSAAAAAIAAAALFLGAFFGLGTVAAAPGSWLLFAWIAHFNILHAVFASNMRYRLPIEPALAVLAGVGWERIHRLTRRPR